MTVSLDKTLGGNPLAEADFDMSDFFYGEYKPVTLHLKQCEGNHLHYVDPNETFIEIGLKGSNEDGLVQKRMSAIKQQMSASLKHTFKVH